jgi:hypothetical protein
MERERPATTEEAATLSTSPREKEKERNEPNQPSGNKQTYPMGNMIKVMTVVQQIMTGLNESLSEVGKIIFITKVVLNLLNEQ